MPSTTEDGRTRLGNRRLQRHWPVAPDPRAALLLVHGVNEHSGRYEHVGDVLSSHGLDVLAFDLQGHGRSEGRQGHIDTFDDYLDDVEDLIEERRRLDLPVVLFGHSLGGLIATAYAASDRPPPDLLVLSAPALAVHLSRPLRAMVPRLARWAPNVRVRQGFDGDLLTRDPEVARGYRDDPLRIRRSSARRGQVILTAMDDTRARLERIKVPVYVFHGSGDRLVPPEASEPFESLEAATRVLHPDLRHECLNEPEGDEVLAGVLAWIDAELDRV
jgi:acylglycerol lipase